MNAPLPATKLTLVSSEPRHIGLIDEAVEELDHAIGHLRLARAYVTPSGVKTALAFSSSSIECAQLVIAGAVEGTS